jgi:predicted transcriptional regulator of viral defense system
MADVARTVIDALDSPSLGGGARHCAEILEAYLDQHDWHQLVLYGDRLGNGAVFKRLGYMVEAAELGTPELARECRVRLTGGVALLDPAAPARGERVPSWGLVANARITAQAAS